MTKQQKRKRLVKLTASLQELLFLHEWDITVRFCESSNDNRYADVLVECEYLRATITFFDLFLREFDTPQGQSVVLDVVIHELSHIITAPSMELLEDECPKIPQKVLTTLNEQQTQRTANAIKYALKRNQKDFTQLINK